jgi:hypothetical protein
VVWWLIPLIATLSAWAYTRLAWSWRGRSKPRLEPGSPEDAADLARFAAALERPMPGGRA